MQDKEQQRGIEKQNGHLQRQSPRDIAAHARHASQEANHRRLDSHPKENNTRHRKRPKPLHDDIRPRLDQAVYNPNTNIRPREGYSQPIGGLEECQRQSDGVEDGRLFV